ncbi:6-phosphogluconolactonase [Colwellia psychrerythraea]|uniref:6-phosphogluconolactonase n=1 Tax=Colwellia psychrerythraea (strain 34H / ATCC BAA-681) TaxID=167879 RepID=Q482L5_COLP3|nr:6-phosphogluconolactonase [Colwellia psychrerythraea]AAZ26224.1 6-phosphogluconolactonase [Colwellia psychrerythraea 34H]
MNELTEFNARNDLDNELASTVSDILAKAIKEKGKASIAVSGGSTPKGFFSVLSQSDIDWSKVTITLADERWVPIDSEASNTRLVHENLLQNKAEKAKFFHLKQGDELTDETLEDLNVAASKILLPLDVLILGMGEDGHTASLFPCSDQITSGLDETNDAALLKVQPKTAPHQRISFTFASLMTSKNIFLHSCGEGKKTVLTQVLNGDDPFEMPIRAFLQHPSLNTQIFWAP